MKLFFSCCKRSDGSIATLAKSMRQSRHLSVSDFTKVQHLKEQDQYLLLKILYQMDPSLLKTCLFYYHWHDEVKVRFLHNDRQRYLDDPTWFLAVGYSAARREMDHNVTDHWRDISQRSELMDNPYLMHLAVLNHPRVMSVVSPRMMLFLFSRQHCHQGRVDHFCRQRLKKKGFMQALIESACHWPWLSFRESKPFKAYDCSENNDITQLIQWYTDEADINIQADERVYSWLQPRCPFQYQFKMKQAHENAQMRLRSSECEWHRWVKEFKLKGESIAYLSDTSVLALARLFALAPRSVQADEEVFKSLVRLYDIDSHGREILQVITQKHEQAKQLIRVESAWACLSAHQQGLSCAWVRGMMRGGAGSAVVPEEPLCSEDVGALSP